MDDPFDTFEKACTDAFGFLVERFGFRPPAIERIGRESFVQYHKGSRTVSIAWEPGGGPVIELFLPVAGTGLPPTPWAERDGVPYARVFPRHERRTNARAAGRKERRIWDEPTAPTFASALADAAANLERMEAGFLSSNGS